MLGLRNPLHILAIAAVYYPLVLALSSESQIKPSNSQQNDTFCNYGGSKTIRFFPGLSADIGVCGNVVTEEDKQCYEDSRTLQQNALNYTLWASLMVDATAAYPTGVLYGNRYHLGNFDGCMAAARISQVGSRYCLAKLSYDDERFRGVSKWAHDSWIDWNDLDPNVDVRYMIQGLGQMPQESSTKSIWVAVCVPRSCGAYQVQRTLQRELQLWHPNLAAVDIPENMCTDEETSINFGFIIYSLVVAGLIGVAILASIWDINGVVPPARTAWIMYWSIPARMKGLMAPEKTIRGVSLQPLAGVRMITLTSLAIAHHCMHVPRAPLLNNFITRKTFMDPIAAFATQAYIFVYTMLFLSGLFLALGSRDTFFRSITLRYLRLTPSYLAVVAFYALAFPSVGSGPLWKSMINPEAEACSNLWWANLLYLNNFIRPSSAHGCLLQSWSLAADMQLCILGTFLLVAYKKWKIISSGILASVTIIFLWIPFFTTLFGYREPIWRFTPSVLEDVWTWPLWDKYVSTEQWASPYLIGLATGLFLEYAAKRNLTVNFQTMRLVIPGSSAMMILLIISGIFWSYPDVDQHSVAAALYATLVPVAWSICLVLISISFALGPPTWIGDVLSSSFFVTTSRLGYSIYLTHFGGQIAHVALMRSPRHVSVIGIVITALQELILILPLCLLMYLLIEAPIRELSKDLFRKKSMQPQLDIQLQPQNAPVVQPLCPESTTTEKESNEYQQSLSNILSNEVVNAQVTTL